MKKSLVFTSLVALTLSSVMVASAEETTSATTLQSTTEVSSVSATTETTSLDTSTIEANNYVTSFNKSAILAGNYASIAGTWKNATGQTLEVSADGAMKHSSPLGSSNPHFIVNPGEDGTKAVFYGGYLNSDAEFGGSAAVTYIPAGVDASDEFKLPDKSDKSQDRIFIWQGITEDYYKEFFYRVSDTTSGSEASLVNDDTTESKADETAEQSSAATESTSTQEVTSETTTQTAKAKKDGLPKTGEEAGTGLTIAGIIGLVLAFLGFKKKSSK